MSPTSRHKTVIEGICHQSHWGCKDPAASSPGEIVEVCCWGCHEVSWSSGVWSRFCVHHDQVWRWWMDDMCNLCLSLESLLHLAAIFHPLNCWPGAIRRTTCGCFLVERHHFVFYSVLYCPHFQQVEWRESAPGSPPTLRMSSSPGYRGMVGVSLSGITDFVIVFKYVINSWSLVWIKIMQDTVREGGWSILYRGFGSTTYRAFIVNGVILLVYNNIMRHFSDSRINL